MNAYDIEVKPTKLTFENGRTKIEKSRASEKTRYKHFNEQHSANVKEKERWAIDIIKILIKRAKKPVVSCSFGIDSIVTLYLTRKALIELGRKPNDIDVVWNNTSNEFKEVRDYAKEMTEKWNIRLIETKPKKTLKKIIDDHGGVDETYFARKGDRTVKTKGTPLSEKCCNTLKHEPMKRTMKEYQWNGIINGLRADESQQRKLASLRDGEFFYSTGLWKSFVARPLLWWHEADLWEYVWEEKIPYNKLYDQNIIKSLSRYEEKLLVELGFENQVNFTKKESFLLKEHGFQLFTPRTGCQMCPIPIRYGYLQWMRINYPKVYDAMVYKLGYGKALLKIVPQPVINEVKQITGVDLTEENAHEYLSEALDGKPCLFDEF